MIEQVSFCAVDLGSLAFVPETKRTVRGLDAEKSEIHDIGTELKALTTFARREVATTSLEVRPEISPNVSGLRPANRLVPSTRVRPFQSGIRQLRPPSPATTVQTFARRPLLDGIVLAHATFPYRATSWNHLNAGVLKAALPRHSHGRTVLGPVKVTCGREEFS